MRREKKKNWEYLFSMHHYCSKFQWWMAVSLINCLLMLSHYWAVEIFLPTSRDLLWQLKQEAVAFWASQRKILTQSHHILFFTINIGFLSPEGGLFCTCQRNEEPFVCGFKRNVKIPKLFRLTSNWTEKKLGNWWGISYAMRSLRKILPCLVKVTTEPVPEV